MTRRAVLSSAAALALSHVAARMGAAEVADPPAIPIFDSHVHVWDLKQFHLPWLDHSLPVLHRDYSTAGYLQAVSGLGVVAAAYIEVNVEPEQRPREAEYVAQLCASTENPIAAGVLAGDPRDPRFKEYVDRFKDRPGTRGVRFLYPRNGSADGEFLKGLQWLGEQRLGFELQLGPGFLADAAQTAEACPQTQFVLNHCGGVEPRVFRAEAEHNPADRDARESWRRGIAAIAKRDNVVCKISGVADAALPGDATAPDVEPIVNFCLDQFGPDRVLFGGNWPVCLKGSTLSHWVRSLQDVVAHRPEQERRKLFFDNGVRIYRVGGSSKLASNR